MLQFEEFLGLKKNFFLQVIVKVHFILKRNQESDGICERVMRSLELSDTVSVTFGLYVFTS